MKIKQTDINKVIPYARNPRNNQGAIAKVAASIKEFGWQQPIVVDSEMVVIAGHTRLAAAQSLGMKTVPVFVASDLTETQVKAYRIADNKIAQSSEWDDDLLALELGDLQETDFDLDILGWDGALPEFSEMPDYSILDDEDMEGQLDEMAAGVKKAIQIEFESQDYELATELVRHFRSQNKYVGKLLIDKLQEEIKKNEAG